jgi:signal transduction histidine kinase
LRELISNAAEAGSTSIEIILQTQNQDVVLTVVDNGEGLDGYRLSKACEPFYTTREGKLGLGLSTARRIAELHNGSLDLESTPSSGTKVTVRIPNNSSE